MLGNGGKKSDAKRAAVMLENLEPRLLLTSLVAPLDPTDTASFYYRNSNQKVIRVSLSNHVSGVGEVELMRWDLASGDVADLPGWYDNGTGTQINIAGGLAGVATQLDSAWPLWGAGTICTALAGDQASGELYAYINTSTASPTQPQLVQVSPLTGMPFSYTDIFDATEPTWSFSVAGMEIVNGVIYATATYVDLVAADFLVPPTGQYLITIDPIAGTGSLVSNPPAPAAPVPVMPAGSITDLTYDFATTNLYGVWNDASNNSSIVLISPFTGTAVVVAQIVNTANNNAAVQSAQGLQFYNMMTYVIAGNAVYTVSLSSGNAAPLTGTLSSNDAADLASDGPNLYAIFTNAQGQTRLAVINTNPPLLSEIFAIYIKASDANTILSFAQIEDQANGNSTTLFPDRIHMWDPAELPTIDTPDGALAPANSGGAIIGSYPTPTVANPNQHQAVQDDSYWNNYATPLGVFPGGLVHGGVMMQGPIGLDIDTSNATGIGLGQDVSALAADLGGTFYAVDNATHQLFRIVYNNLVNPPTAAAVVVGTVADAVEASFVYDQIQALDFDAAGNLYAVATILDTVPGAPVPPAGAWLVRIDTTTGLVSRVVQLNSATPFALTSIAFDGGRLYAFDQQSHSIVTINTATGAIAPVTVLTFNDDPSSPEITGIEVDSSGEMYAVGAEGLLYDVDLAAGMVSSEGETDMDDLTGLAYSDNYPDYLWSVRYRQGTFQLVRLDPDTPPMDIGRLLVAGTVAGKFELTGSVQVLEMGYLFGNGSVLHDAGNIIVRTDAGHDTYLGSTLTQVGGTLGEFHVYGNFITSVDVRGDTGIPAPHNNNSMVDYSRQPLVEAEMRGELLLGNTEIGDELWAMQGQMYDVVNTTPADAQFLHSDSDSVAVWGELWGWDPGGAPLEDLVDYYAVNLFAGQTISARLVEGHVADPAQSLISSLALGVFTGNGTYLSSLGINKVMGTRLIGEEAMEFTAPSAGIYYFAVSDTSSTILDPMGGTDLVGFYDYSLFIENANSASLGVLRVGGDILAAATMAGEERYDVSVHHGSLGAVLVAGNIIGTYFQTFGEGDIGSIHGGNWTAGGKIVSHHNIGSVSSDNVIQSTIVAGADWAKDDNDAFIQNVTAVGDLTTGASYASAVDPTRSISGLWASGSIGAIRVGGVISTTVYITINGDDLGPTGYLDLIEVTGDWMVPELRHGVNADIGKIYVGGLIHSETGGVITVGEMRPINVTDGRPSLFHDDGGGEMTIAPGVLVDPATGQPLMVPDPLSGFLITQPTPYRYFSVPVYNLDGVGKVGEVMVRLIVDGPASLKLMKADDDVAIGRLEMNGAGDYRLTGTGHIDVFYAAGTGVTNFSNTTDGDVVSGSFDAINRIQVHGNLGRTVGELGEWLAGLDVAPATTQMGWFDRRINGLTLTGDVQQLTVDGWLGDIYSTGRIVRARVNADDQTAPDSFEGVVGVVEVNSLGELNVGDGLSAPGTGDKATAAIIGDGWLERIIVDGKGRYIRGAIMANVGQTDPITGLELPAIWQVIGRNGATLERSLIGAMSLDAYLPYLNLWTFTGSIGTVDVSGKGSLITDTRIMASTINRISTSVDSGGINYTYIYAHPADVTPGTPERDAIGLVQGGGTGIYQSEIYTHGQPIRAIRAVGPAADIRNSIFESNNATIYEISTRDFFKNSIMGSARVKKIKVTRDAIGNTEINLNSLDSMTVAGNFAGNVFHVASELTSLTVAGSFVNSTLDFFGPDSRLGTLKVNSDISGQILAAGRIGSVISTKGSIAADIQTLANESTGNVGLISAFGGYTGALDVAGNLTKFMAYAHLGVDPSQMAGFVPKRLNIAGDLGSMIVKGSRTAPAVDLYSSIYVGGNLGSLAVDGRLCADIFVNGNLGRLTTKGDIGGLFNIPTATVLGNLTVMGTLGKLAIPSGASIVGDLTTGGTIVSIALSDKSGLAGRGDILGDITSLHGAILSISLSNGTLSGDVTAATGIGKIMLKGTVADPADVTEEIESLTGNIGLISITGGKLDADVVAGAGNINQIIVNGGSITAGHTIEAAGKIGAITVTGGDLDADLVSSAGLDSLDIRGSDLTGNLDIGGSIGKISVQGTVDGATIWSGGMIGSLTAGKLSGAVLSSLLGMSNVAIVGDVANSSIVGGYNSATAQLHSANIGSVKVGGNWDTSVLAVGVDPVDGSFTTLADNLAAPGVSSLGSLSVTGFPLGANNLVIADTSVGSVPGWISRETVDTTAPALGAFQFGPGTTYSPDGVTITLSGNGMGSYDQLTGAIILNNVDAGTSLALSKAGLAKTVSITAGDDAMLGTLSATGSARLGDVSMDGRIGSLSVQQAQPGSTWTVPGGLGQVSTQGLNNVNLDVGEIASWAMAGDLQNGTIVADGIGVMSVSGNLNTPIAVDNGGIGALSVGGMIQQDLTAKYTIGSITTGGVTAGIHVTNGDLSRLSVKGDLAGDVNVDVGAIGALDIYGNFGSQLADNAIRSMNGIGSYRLTGGNSTGLISTGGLLGSLSVSGGQMSSRVRAAGGIGAISVDSLVDALITSAGNIGKVSVKGNMTDSDLVSGFDPGDDGLDVNNAGNSQFDWRTNPTDKTAGNVDVLSGGSIAGVRIGGDMSGSSIAASVSPGHDGWFGTFDDEARGVGTVGKVSVGGTASGSPMAGEHYSIIAATGMPIVTARRLFTTGNFSIATLASSSGSPQVVKMEVHDNRLIIYFNHDINLSTFNTAQIDPTRPTTLTLLVSRDGTFGPGDLNISDTIPNTLSYDSTRHALTFRLNRTSRNTFTQLNAGTQFQLTLDSTVVADARGYLLDGEYDRGFPSGNGLAGGDFVYNFVYGDAGDTPQTAMDLTNVIFYDQVLQQYGNIGDGNPAQPWMDTDVYQIQVSTGDILYFDTTGGASLSGTATFTQSVTGVGYLMQSDGLVWLTLGNFATGPYSLDILLFNDDNSNFAFDAASQTPEPMTWTGNVAQPPVDSQQIVAPDDTDVFSLGSLPANTRLDLSLETILVGSPLEAKLAVFNSAGDLVGSVFYTRYPTGMDIANMPSGNTLNAMVITPADDTYYVAVTSMGLDPDQVASSLLNGYIPYFQQYYEGRYSLSVSKSTQAPDFQTQVVYLNFNGGDASFLTNATALENAQNYPYPTDQSIFSPAVFGFANTSSQALLNAIYNTVTGNFAGFGNIQFTTVKPSSGPYTTIYISGDESPDDTIPFLAEKLDTLNKDRADDGVVWAGEIANNHGAAMGETVADVGMIVGNAISHVVGHLLGLNHVAGVALMDPGSYETATGSWGNHDSLITTLPDLFPIGYQNSIGSLWAVA